jgi:hypothetical protein
MDRRAWSLACVWLLAAVIAAPGTAGDSNPRPSPAQPQPVVVKVDSGFDWVDAGLGAAAAVAGLLVVAGLALIVRTGPFHIEKRQQ